MLCLKVPTDPEWAAEALASVDAVLVDHAHCEIKAASNALSLAARHPDDLELVKALTDLSREEIDHFQRVLSLIEARGLVLGPPPVDEYAAELRRAAQQLPAVSFAASGSRHPSLVDRLLVGALIEARSCERFKLLAEGSAQRDAPGTRRAGGGELHSLWSELLAAEARHYRTFVDLAVRAAGGDRDGVARRLDRLADLEGTIVAALSRRASGPSRATIHG
jgi:tRNA-(ms[2]io[6]A)-hydroxylase